MLMRVETEKLIPLKKILEVFVLLILIKAVAKKTSE